MLPISLHPQASIFPSRTTAFTVSDLVLFHLEYGTAIPDPHMNELKLMSYEPKHRECKDLYKVPGRSDYIEVPWCLDYLPGMPMRWWPAEVLHVSGPLDQDYLATGVIRYIPSDSWGEQFEFVDFLERRKLRCSANDNNNEEQHPADILNQKNDNPCLEWRFRSEQKDTTGTDSDDEDWCNTAPSGADFQEKLPLNRGRKEGTAETRYDVELKKLRNGHAAMTVEVEKLKRELVRVSNVVSNLQNTGGQHPKCTSAACVLPRIRQKLALKMQASVRKAPVRKRKRDGPDQDLSIGYVDGVNPGVIRARVECTLQQFESLSRQVRAQFSKDTVFFFPDFSYTQLPLKCSSEFKVLFKTFSHLCDSIGIVSSADKKEMARKCGTGKGNQGETIRLLGIYCYDKNDECKPAHFFPGTSCGGTTPHESTPPSSEAQSTSALSDKADPLFPVLTRKTREWNNADSRFKHGLRKKLFRLPALTENCSDETAFAMTWKRVADLGGNAWSQALRDSREVFGWLEVCLPFLQTQGKQRCQELGGLGNDDMWDELLSTDW